MFEDIEVTHSDIHFETMRIKENLTLEINFKKKQPVHFITVLYLPPSRRTVTLLP